MKVFDLPERGDMTENNEQPINEEAQAEGKIPVKFREARERTMKEADSLSEIYRSIKNPGGKDVYNAWVKNMDTVANSYSWGKDKPALRTRILWVTNRLVGGTAALITVPSDLIADSLSWPLRKFPILKQTVGHFVQTDFFKKHSMKAAEDAKTQGLILRYGDMVKKATRKLVEVPFAVTGAAFKQVSIGFPLQEARAGWQFLDRKIDKVTESILHPKPKVA